jgi:glycosyltransferase involved in cell wall biosynthesis
MKVVMINDCAFVGETLLKFLPSNVEKEHIKRGRRLWGKTFGLSYNILRSRGNIYHAHYLLQDCYLASLLGKRPLVGHAHGSDLRSSLWHPIWGWVVRRNLKNCDKVLVSTPDILGVAREFRKDASYFPNPVNTELFYPRQPRARRMRTRVLIASDSNWNLKGTDLAIRALAKVKEHVDVSIVKLGVDFEKTLVLANSLGLRLNILRTVPHEKLNEYYWDADVVIDRFKMGSLGLVSLEAIACGRPAITYVPTGCPEYRDFPLKNVNTIDKIAEAIMNASRDLWKEEYSYLEDHHVPQKAVKKIREIYLELLEK